MFDGFTEFEQLALRPLAAVVGAAALGWERSLHEKPAGLRTHMMVGLGSAVFTVIVMRMTQGLPGTGAPIQIDPTRVIQGIVGGIGFLGAGAIIQSRGSITGITTAATIWVVGALGIACGVGYYLEAAITVVLGLFILSTIGGLEMMLLGKHPHESTEVTPESSPQENGQ